jgi:hypothetical protein
LLHLSPRRPLARQRKGHPDLLEELVALQDALEASEERRDMLETTLLEVLATVSAATFERLLDDLLRRVFARLPQPVQDTLHQRLFPPA